MGPVPPWGSGFAEALPSLLKRPCTSVATSGPGVRPRQRTDGVGVVGKVLGPSPVVVGDRRWFPLLAATRRCVAPRVRRLDPAAVRRIPAQCRISNKASASPCDMRDAT
ncbi:hypothetical protein GCM10018787_41280 [Streptomyces thermodiastaticus]|nr:hypothetical protein GCM10018787_41280 [Streptomyces thermodiastaticus]